MYRSRPFVGTQKRGHKRVHGGSREHEVAVMCRRPRLLSAAIATYAFEHASPLPGSPQLKHRRIETLQHVHVRCSAIGRWAARLLQTPVLLERYLLLVATCDLEMLCGVNAIPSGRRQPSLLECSLKKESAACE